jgi:hypothetical protein
MPNFHQNLVELITSMLLGNCFQECKERVEKDHTGEKHCTGQYFDFWSCIDKCVSAPLDSYSSFRKSLVTSLLVNTCSRLSAS